MANRDSPGATPRLRYDKVALRLVQGVRGALEGAVPDGLCVIYAVTAPIVAEAVGRVGAGRQSHAGAFSLGQLVDARDVLDTVAGMGHIFVTWDATR